MTIRQLSTTTKLLFHHVELATIRQLSDKEIVMTNKMIQLNLKEAQAKILVSKT